MRGLLASRVLKGPSGAERLSRSLYRHPKLHKRSKRPFLSRPKASPHRNLSRKAAAKGREAGEAKEDGAHADYGVVSPHAEDSFTHTFDDLDCAKRDSFDCFNDDSNDLSDHVAGLRSTGEEGTKVGIESKVAGTYKSDNEDDSCSDYDVMDVNDNVVEIEGSAEELEEDQHEEEEDVPKDDSHTAPGYGSCNVHHASGDLHNNGNGAIEWHDNYPYLQEEGSPLNSTDRQKGPVILPDWEAVMSAVADMPAAICFICGGKNSGKSTFARYLVNSLLNRYRKVGFLDTDVGQPEFTPSGCLSLHVLDKPIVGLPALEMKDPERCYFFGDTSPKSNPEDYLKGIFSLFDHFKNKYTLNESEIKVSLLEKAQFPLVINTHGWIQGVGLDVLIKIFNHVMPTHVVQIVSKTASRNLPQNQFWESSTTAPWNSQLLYINNALGDNTHLAEIKYDARELRDLRLIAYFQKTIIDNFLLTCRLSSLFEKAATALACCKPFQVPISAINVVQQHCEVPAGEVVYSLNATLVGLGVSDEKEQDSKPWCFGLGIVRAVDVSRGLYYVITPLKREVLRRVNTFFQGKMEIPVSLLKAPRYVSPYLCKHTISMEGTGSAVMGKGKKKVLRTLRSPAIL